MPAPFTPKTIFVTLCFACLLLAGCDFLEPAEPVVLPTVTPPGDMLILNSPKFTYTLVDNQKVPGTNIIYRSRDENNVYVDMDGQPSVRRFGDFLNGSKIIVPSVLAKYNLQLINTTFDNPFVVGPVTLTVFNPAPIEITSLNANPVGASVVYDGINIDYRVPVGRSLPGTTVTYLGNGEFGANLSGSSQFRTLPEGNSFIWTGRLHAYAVIQYDLRAVRVTTEELQMVGTAKLYLYDQPLLSEN